MVVTSSTAQPAKVKTDEKIKPKRQRKRKIEVEEDRLLKRKLLSGQTVERNERQNREMDEMKEGRLSNIIQKII